LHPDGSLYFTGDLGGYGQIWDLRTGKGIHEIKEPDSILCCDFSSNGYELALGGKSNMISIKDIRRLKTMKQIPAHTKLISGLKYDKNESILCSVSHDNSLRLWHGRNYISVNLEPHMHASKLTSVDIHEGKIAATTIERKWFMWVLKNHGKAEVKME
jgi:U4/U6 small nuclear ribonucleoprotein PRP4